MKIFVRQIAVRVIIALLFLLACATQAKAQVSGSIEVQSIVSDSPAVPQINTFAKGPIKGKIGWSLWTITSEVWSEGYAGLTYAPVSWVEVSGSIGLETADNPMRYGASLSAGKGRLSFYTSQEYGGSGYWQKNILSESVNSTLSVGVLQQTFFGAGPYLEGRYTKKLTVWGAVAVDNPGMMLGGRFNF